MGGRAGLGLGFGWRSGGPGRRGRTNVRSVIGWLTVSVTCIMLTNEERHRVKCWKSKTSVASLNDQQRVEGLQGVTGGKLGTVSSEGSGADLGDVWNVADDSAIAGTG
jgi:hypothetical protein